MTAMLNRKLDFKVNSVSQLLDLIETWGFRQDIRHVKDIKDIKDIMNIVDDNNNNNKGNDSDVKIQNCIINFTQYLSTLTWDLCEDIKDVMDINNIIDDNNKNNNNNDNKSCVKIENLILKRLEVMQGHQGCQRDQQHYG